MTTTSTCRSCRAPVRWVTTEAGKAMPLDPDPDHAGNIVPRPSGLSTQIVAHVLTADELNDVSGEVEWPRYISHFATCPNADQHRRRP